MPKLKCKILVAAAFLSLLALLLPVSIFAQEGLGFATSLSVEGENIQNGDIVSFKDNRYYLSSTPYDQNLYGVIAKKPAIAISFEGQKGQPVINKGVTLVNVKSVNGVIRKGDYVTSSNEPGKGMKAVNGGFIVGIALDDYLEEDKSKVGQINISVNATYTGGTTLSTGTVAEIFNLSAVAATGQPAMVVKYLVAGIVLITSFAVGFLFFGKVATKGVEALGRNPMARGTIQFGIILNVLITVTIVFSGLLISYLMLRL